MAGHQLAHEWRVAAWCSEVARRREVSDVGREALERAAILHHQPRVLLDRTSLAALCVDVGVPSVAPEDTGGDDIDSRALDVLRAFWQEGGVSEESKELAHILEQCDELDMACELDADSEPESDSECGESMMDVLSTEVGSVLRMVQSDEVERAALCVPVFPAVAREVLSLLARDDANLEQLNDLVSEDQTLAACVVGAANSAAYATRIRVSSIREAIARMGLVRARRVVCAAACRRLFSAPHSHMLWNHTLDVAQAAAELAAAGGTNVEEAFLAGLVHDLGRPHRGARQECGW